MHVDLQEDEAAFHAELGVDTDAVETEAPAAPVEAAEPAEREDATEPDAPASDGEADAQAVGAEAAAPNAPAPASAAEPFAVTVHGQQHTLAGVTYDRGARAFRVADDRAFQRVQNLLTKGREWETRGRQELHHMRRELEAERTRRTDREAQAEAYLAEWQRLMQLPDEQFYAFAQAARQEWPRVQAQAERAVAEAKLAEVQRMQQPAEPDPESLLEQAQEGAAGLVQHVLQDQPWADPQTQQALVQWMQSPSVLGQFVYRAPQDVPQYGVRQGQWVADWDRARALLVEYAKPLYVAWQTRQAGAGASAPSAAGTTGAAPASVAPVAQQNARVLATAGRAKTPAPAPRGPTGSTTPAAGSRRDARKALDDDLERIAREVLRAS